MWAGPICCRAVDFDDLLGVPVYILQQFAHVRARYQRVLKQILVDEFQVQREGLVLT